MNKKKFNENLKKAKNWDGKSRISTDLYRHNYNEIFRKKTGTNQETIGNKGIFYVGKAKDYPGAKNLKEEDLGDKLKNYNGDPEAI